MSAQLEWDATPNLVDLLIEEQQTLSAVETFSAYHDRADAHENRYEALIPSSLPEAHQQYAFRVDLDACTGCKACVTACHNLNGLEEAETWRTVGVVEEKSAGGCGRASDQQTVTSACHHCESPACLAGCPVRAYEKDPSTGIVRHLDDQCIGCRYCQLMCPYDVPTYSERLGVVRKCDMCQGRLAEGEAPACVQGCPNEAISISIVDAHRERASRLLPVARGAMPDSKWTRPTTRYVSSRGSGTALSPIDTAHVEASEPHRPLAWMLVLTQGAIGAVLFEGLFSLLPDALAPTRLARALALSLAAGIGFAGLGASVFHLGRPQWAFRALLGLRTSWMSREIVALGGFAALLATIVGVAWFDWALAGETLSEAGQRVIDARGGVLAATAFSGLVGLVCSIQIYAVTGRPLWRFDRTSLRFGSTAAWLGLAVGHLGIAAGEVFGPMRYGSGSSPLLSALAMLVVLATIAKIELEAGHFVSGGGEERIALSRTRALLASALRQPFDRRRAILGIAGCLLPTIQIALVLGGVASPWILGVAIGILALGLLAEFLERDLFFRSEAMPSMPGAG